MFIPFIIPAIPFPILEKPICEKGWMIRDRFKIKLPPTPNFDEKPFVYKMDKNGKLFKEKI